MRAWRYALWALVVAGCPDKEKVVVIWAAADVRGTVAPCGCTTDPLGGLDKVAAVVAGEKRPHLLVAAGPMTAEEKTPETQAKGALVAKTLANLGLANEGMHDVGGVKIA